MGASDMKKTAATARMGIIKSQAFCNLPRKKGIKKAPKMKNIDG